MKAGDDPIEASIKRIDPPNIPQSMIELSKILGEEVTRIIGANEELLGSATDDKAGILSMLRQGAGLTTLQPIFDKLDYSQRLYGKLRMQAIRKNFTKEKVKRILGHDPDPRFFTSHSLKYSVAVEEGNYSTTQRQMELQQLLHFKEIGMPISDQSIMKAAFITNKKELMKELAESAQQQQQAQQQQMQQEQQEAQSKIMANTTKSRVDLAKEKELLSQVDENESNAAHHRAAAELDLVKAMIALEADDLAVMQSAFDLVQSIKMGNNPESKTSPKGGQNETRKRKKQTTRS